MPVMLNSLRITNPDGDILGANRQVFTPLHSNVSNWVRAVFEQYQTHSKYIDTVFDTCRSDSNTVRNMNKLRAQTGAYGTTISYVLLHCIRRVRTGFESLRQISNPFKFPLIQYLIQLEHNSNPARNTYVHNPIVHEVHLICMKHPFVYEVFSSNAN